MNHALILPILLPFLAGISLLFLKTSSMLTRRLSLMATVALVPLAVLLLILAGDGGYRVYLLGHWPAPFGIVLMLDRLAPGGFHRG